MKLHIRCNYIHCISDNKHLKKPPPEITFIKLEEVYRFKIMEDKIISNQYDVHRFKEGKLWSNKIITNNLPPL